jgi:hypothetical protein
MGKRGPAPKGEFGDKSAVLSTRISSELRARLEAQVEQSGLTLSREIEHRLRRSFIDDEKISEGYGNRRNLAIMKILSMMIEAKRRPNQADADWLEDPWLFDQVVISLNAILEGIRPAGEIKPPAHIFGDVGASFFEDHPEMDTPEFHRTVAVQKAAALLDGIHQADPALPLEDDPSLSAEKARAVRLRRKLKVDLGPLTQRAWDRSGVADAKVATKPPKKSKRGIKK